MRALVVGALVGALLLGWPSPCWACTCVPLGPREYADNADVIFTGRVIEAEDPFRNSGPRVQATLAVEVRYKGPAGDRVVVETYRGGSVSCGVEFAEGRRYTIFAYANERGRLETNICAATARGTIDPSRFGLPRGGVPPQGVREPTPVIRVADPASDGGATSWLFWGPWLVLLGVGIVAGLNIRRSRRTGS